MRICAFTTTVKYFQVSTEIWNKLGRGVRQQDLRLQKTQTLLCKAMIPILRVFDKALHAKRDDRDIKPKEIMDLISDGYKIMAFGFNDISYRRRELIIQPHRNPQCRYLCSSETPVTGQLFGDDLANHVDELLRGQNI